MTIPAPFDAIVRVVTVAVVETLEPRQFLSAANPTAGHRFVLVHPTWQGPIVIKQGGTYSGHWQSLDPDVSAVIIDTTAPVTIRNASIRSAGDCISNGIDGVNLKVLRTTGQGLNPNVIGRAPGRFVDINNFHNVIIQNNTFAHTSGIYLGYYQGDRSAAMSVKVLRNAALDIDGRHSDGHGGFLAGSNDCDLVQFCQLAYVQGVPGMQIAWNQVVNQPGLSRVEDNISIYRSSGTAGSPILIHDNFIRGAYPVDPATQDFSGGGIMLGDGVGTAAADDSGYVRAYNNQVVSTTNYGISIASGHDASFYDNRIISSGLLPGGTWIVAQNVGASVWNAQADPNFANNSAYNNLIGWMHKDDLGQVTRNDQWLPAVVGADPYTALSGTITLQIENAEYALWVRKITQAGVSVGASAISRRQAAG